MDNLKNNKFSSHFKLTAVLTGGITITFSIIYILLAIVAIIFNQRDCVDASKPGERFWTIVTNAYIREGEGCGDYHFDITSAYTVFVLVVITLTVSVLCLVSASVLIAIILDEGNTRYLNMVLVAYIGTSAASLVVDITTAAHFGKDHSTLTSELNTANFTQSNFAQIYVTDVLRQGTFFFMSISLKGYIGLAINWVLIILLVVYAVEHRKMMKNSEHSIHKLGALNAYDQPRRPDDNNWATIPNTREPEIFSPFARGAHVNNGYNDDDSDRSARRTPMRSETNYSNRSDYDRSDSWNRAQPNMSHGSRPFSYLEDQRRPVVPAKPAPSPAVEAPWTRRDPWPQPLGPPVPVPDYSPTPRLKSALKPGGYM